MFTTMAIRSKLALNQSWLERGILAINARQTADEQASSVTIHDNARGWNAADAKYGAYLARYITKSHRPQGSRLSGRFVDEARKLMRKYAGQLVRVANEGQALAA